MPFARISADLRRVARCKLHRNPPLRFDGLDVGRLDDRNSEAIPPQMFKVAIQGAVGGRIEQVALETVDRFQRKRHADRLRMFGHLAHALDRPFPFIFGGALAAEHAQARVERSGHHLAARGRATIQCLLVRIDPAAAHGRVGG